MTNIKKVGIVGTHGLPANYSGWETLVKHLIDRRKNIDYLIATPSFRKSQQNSTSLKTSIENFIPLIISIKNFTSSKSIFAPVNLSEIFFTPSC